MVTLIATIDGITWEACISPGGEVEIYRAGQLFDRGYDDGEVIHHTRRTPKAVLEALEAAYLTQGATQ